MIYHLIVITRLLLLLVLLAPGALQATAPSSAARSGSPEPTDVPALQGIEPHARGGTEMRLRLPEAPAAVLPGGGATLPATPLRDGLNHRTGLQLDPDGTPSDVTATAAPLGLDARDPGRAVHRSTSRAVPLFASSIPPPHLG